LGCALGSGFALQHKLFTKKSWGGARTKAQPKLRGASGEA
jgi:hypothetical protein